MAGLIQDIKLFGEDIPWFQGLREKGMEAFRRQGVPTAKTEAWKYTKPRDLNADDFVMNDSAFLAEFEGAHEEEHSGCCHHHGENCHCHEEGCRCGEEIDVRVDLPFDGYQLHFLNGRFVPVYPVLPRGVEIMTLMEAVVTQEAKPYLGHLVDLEHYPFAALNTAYMEEGVYIRIDRNVKLDKPVILVNHTEAGAENLFYNLRNLIVVESGAKAELIEWYNYTGAEKSRYFANVVNEIFVERGAELRHYKMQDEAFKANHVALNMARVRSGGFYDAFCLQRGANIGRNETKVLLKEEQAAAEVNAAYIMHGWATLDTTTDIEHLAPETFSHQLVRGVVGGDAKGVFQGDLGRSWFNSTEVIDDLIKRFPATFELITLSLIFALFMGLFFALVSARRPKGIVAGISRVYGLLAGAFADFWLGLMLIYIFYTVMQIAVSPVGRIDLIFSPPPFVTGMYILDSIIAGDWVLLKNSIAHLALPVLTLGFIQGASIMKMTLATMNETLESDFIFHARLLGISERKVMSYAFRNSASAIVMNIGNIYSYLLGGAVLVETVFSWGGLGQYVVAALENKDYNCIQGYMLVATIFSMLVYLIIDVIQMMADPRIKY